VYRDGHLVSRRSDLIIYSVEAALIYNVVAQYGPSTKMGAIVSGQTSVKAPEQRAFETHLPADSYIVSCHSLHGPKVDPTGQPLVLIQHRAPDEKMRLMERIMAAFGSRIVLLSYQEHDVVTANTQAVTHAAFLAMGAAWRCSGDYPWETDRWAGPIETVKINIMIRILSAKWHVYAGLAILNPSARIQVTQYAKSVSDLFKLMIADRHDEMLRRVFEARRKVFGWQDDEQPAAAGEGGAASTSADASTGASTATTRQHRPILMSDAMLEQFHQAARKVAPPPPVDASTAAQPAEATEQTTNSASSAAIRPPNSHLSLLAIVDCWHHLGIDPYAHLELAATPIFRIWIGVCEYLFRSPARLRASIRAAVEDPTFRGDDTEFVVAARGWAEAVNAGNFEHYEWRFKDTARFFEPRFEEANKVGAEMLKVVMSSR
jgi:prephenate dehydrogenase (NADP+)